ncbi:MAG: M48 family metallopeptidase [Actinomycetota bacterium]|nr:M48 family metallopeptidase [Actinomycetota bacterium]
MGRRHGEPLGFVHAHHRPHPHLQPVGELPRLVVDYVIVHELAHLEVHGHGADFWQLANRYPKAERAIGYLIAKAGDSDALD